MNDHDIKCPAPKCECHHEDRPADPYFMFCHACNCYEYDCHGFDGCIKNDDDYKPAHQRARERTNA